ncbi:STAS domain-containing protein [Saccharothrix sp. S26]|uniref:STAS domain-containing protein n=1 Tax=Saccharothrix sp. S26 TaxID=2907215 RepID=UPI001F33E641|nr:STAS domain-containing protein [Saccharothrix sp. S26]MCE6996367.1 STAS domain-containing protein [Saccharothrix sp. S26]
MDGRTDPGAPISVDTTWHDRVVVVAVHGEVDMDTCDELRSWVVEALDGRPGALVLDLTGVVVFGSIGLSLLIEARHRAQRCAAGFAVATDQRAVLSPLAETGVLDLLDVRPTVPEAAEVAMARGTSSRADSR